MAYTPTTAACGTTGSTSLGGEITKWSLNLILQLQDASSMSSSGNSEFIGCLKEASFSFNSLTPCGAIGSEAGLTFTNSKGTWEFDAIIDSISTNVDVKGICTWTYGGKSTGPVAGPGMPVVGP